MIFALYFSDTYKSFIPIISRFILGFIFVYFSWDKILDPRQMWNDKSQYDLEASNLANLFKGNFEKYGDSLKHLKEFGPK